VAVEIPVKLESCGVDSRSWRYARGPLPARQPSVCRRLSR